MGKKLSKAFNRVGLVCVGVAIAFLVIFLLNVLVAPFAIGFTSGYEYEKKIGCHFYNAADSSTHVAMRDSILIAIDNLHEDGVNNESYCCLVLRTENDRMGHWFGQLYGIIDRLNDAIEWFANDSNNEEYADVYGFKLENIRSNLEKITGTSGDLVLSYRFKYAWYIENHPIRHVIVWWTWWISALLGLIAIGLAPVAFGLEGSSYWWFEKKCKLFE